MQMSAAVWRNAVCGPGCAEIVVLGDGDIIGHPPPAEAVGLTLPGRRWRRLPTGTLAARSVCTGVPPSQSRPGLDFLRGGGEEGFALSGAATVGTVPPAERAGPQPR